MADMKTEKKNTVMPKEDLQLYRLLAIFGAAFLGFAGLRLINEEFLLSVLTVGRWIALFLMLLSLALPVYVRVIKKKDERGKVFTSMGISYFSTTIFFMLAAYPAFQNANVKFQVAYAAISVFAVICVTFREEFRCISALSILCAAFLYYVNAPVFGWLEGTIALLSKGMIFLLPAAVAAVTLVAYHSKKGAAVLFGRTLMRRPSKFSLGMLLSLCVFFEVVGALVFLFPAAFLYVMLAILAFTIIIGIVCTIKVM